MIPLAPKHALVALLTAAAVRGYPLPSRQAESIIERGLSDSVGHLIDKVKSGVGNVVHGAGELLGIGSGGPNHTPTVPIAKDVFAELSKGALYSNAAYCSAGAVKSWSCGATCDALGDVKVAFTGGDNKKVPAFFVAFDPSIQSVVVATQGTEPTELKSLLVDAQFLQDPLNRTNFPSAPPTAKVHQGFQKAFEATSQTVLDQVTALMTANKVNKILITGHSLGAAISSLQAAFLKEKIGNTAEITVRGYGLPRVGNLEWAEYVETILGVGNQFLHMHVGKDPVPTVPPASILNYTHPAGEVYDNLKTEDGSSTIFCPGRENQLCSASNDLLKTNILDHIGPFATIRIGIFDCRA